MDEHYNPEMSARRYAEEEKSRLEIEFLRENLRRRKLESSSRVLIQMIATTTAVFSVFLVFSTLDKDSNKSISLPFFSNKNQEDTSKINSQIEQLEAEIVSSKKELELLKTSLNKPLENRDINFISTRLTVVEKKVTSLNETVLEQPDMAITAKLLRDKQANNDSKLEGVISDQQRLEDKVDNFLSNLISVPIYATLAGIILTLVAAIFPPFLTKSKEFFFGNSRKEKEITTL